MPGHDRLRATAVLGVFAKHWTPGATKTRLATTIGAERAAEASLRFLKTTLERLADKRLGPIDRVVAYTPVEQDSAFAELLAETPGDWRQQPQSTGHLGQRMRRFFEEVISQSNAALLVGTDSPNVPLDSVAQATAWLAEAGDKPRLVLGPTDDGGYWLIGVAGALPPIFDDLPWSTPQLLDATVERLAEAGWRQGADYRLLAPWYDVDEAADLERLRSGLRDSGDSVLNRLADELDALLGPA